jgi:hypothetical protein
MGRNTFASGNSSVHGRRFTEGAKANVATNHVQINTHIVKWG